MAPSTKSKKYICSWDGCGKNFTRSDHLQRHVMNHSADGSTCSRCSLHFKRPDLLDRHMARHQQKDDEAGGRGLGVMESRKRLWRDASGNIVSKRPPRQGTFDATNETSDSQHEPVQQVTNNDGFDMTTGGSHTSDSRMGDPYAGFQTEPLSPPRSMLSSASTDHTSYQMPEVPGVQNFVEPLSGLDMFDFLANSSWGAQPSDTSLNAQAELPFGDIFKPDTASSFNMPFTTMNNYNWLFNTDSVGAPMSTQQNFDLAGNVQGLSQPHLSQLNSLRCDTNVSTDQYNLANPSNMMPTTPPSTLSSGFDQPQGPSFYPTLRDHNSERLTYASANRAFADNFPPEESTNHSRPDRNFSSSSSRLSVQQSQLQRKDGPRRDVESASFDRLHTRPSPRRSCMPTIDDLSRSQILDLITKARPTTPEGTVISRDHHLLTLCCMQDYLDLYFSRFNMVYPLLHQATFVPSETEPLLLLAVLLLGATYGGKDVHRLAVCIHDILRAQIFQHPAFAATPQLWMLQTILLVECFGKFKAGQKQHDMAHLFHGLLINLIRRSDCQTVPPPKFQQEDDLESDWRKAIDVELRKRLAFFCFLWDTQHAVLFSQSLCMSSFELRTTLPCSQTTWEATSAEEWWKHARKEEPISFLAVLKSYVNPHSGAPVPDLDGLSRLLVLHGLMSVQWDMKRREQTSLGDARLSWSGRNSSSGGVSFGTPEVDTGTQDQLRWQDCLAQSYDAWKADFDTYCMNTTQSLSDSPSQRAEFIRSSTATVAIYHAAHISLNVEVLDFQIYAGARHIIGRPVTRADYERSRKMVTDWTKPGGSGAGAKAAWHAAHLLRDGVMRLDNWDVNNAFHYPWCLYLSTLTCWAFHFAHVSDKTKTSTTNTTPNHPPRPSAAATTTKRLHDDDGAERHAKAEMNALVSSMTSVGPENLWRVLGKHSTGGLTAVMAKHLGNVRWAVVHEGVKVLKCLAAE